MKKFQSPSHTQEKCMFPGCKISVRKDRMKDHLRAIHGEKSFVPPNQPSLKGFLNTVTKTLEQPSKHLSKSAEPSSVASDVSRVSNLASVVERNMSLQQPNASTAISTNHQDTDVVNQQNIMHDFSQLKANKPLEKPASARTSVPVHQAVSNVNPEAIQYRIPDPQKFNQLFVGHKKNPTQHKVPIPSTNLELPLEKTQTTADTPVVSCLPEVLEIDCASDVAFSETSKLSSSKKASFFGRLRSKLSLKKRKIGDSTASLVNEDFAVIQAINFVQEDVCDIKVAIKDLASKVANLHTNEEPNAKIIAQNDSFNVNKSRELDARCVLIRASKSIDELMVYAKDFMANESEDTVACQLCTGETASKINHGNRVAGQLKYNFSHGVDFGNISQPRDFINLKSLIIKHLGSACHIDMLAEAEMALKQNDKALSRNYKVGIHLGMQAYKLLKTGGSHNKFELEISTLSAQGIDVGNINHSRKFVADFALSVKNILQCRLQTLINTPLEATNRPVPFSLIADKMTPNRTTMQIVGFMAYVGNKFSPLIAGVPSLQGCDGLSVTKCIRSAIASLNISQDDLGSRLLGGAFDGEYFNLKVPNHLSSMLLLNDEQKRWFTYQWDPAHILELAEKDSTQAMQNVMKCINNVSKSFSYGKSFKELLQEAENENIEMEKENDEGQGSSIKKSARVPCHFSDTRFATYSADVLLKKWHHNYAYYYKIMNRRQDDDLDKIDNAQFVFSSGALIDVYTVIGKLSNAVQKPTLTHWEVQKTILLYQTILDNMSTTFESWANSKNPVECINAAKSSELLPTFASILEEVHEKGEFKGCPIFAKKHTVHSTRTQLAQDECQNSEYTHAFISTSKVLSNFIQKFNQNFSSRLEKEDQRNPIFRHIDLVFDIENIIGSNSKNCMVDESLEEYFNLAKGVGSIQPELEFQNIVSQYQIFAERVKVECANLKLKRIQLNEPFVLEQGKIYARFLQEPELYKDIPDILHLALTAVSRTHCEAVVEGMGSVLGLNSQNRTRLSPETVETEAIIRWQGPHPSVAKPLVEKSLDHKYSSRKDWNFCVMILCHFRYPNNLWTDLPTLQDHKY